MLEAFSRLALSFQFQSAPCVQGEWSDPFRLRRNSLLFQSAPCVQGEWCFECDESAVKGVSIRALRAGRMFVQRLEFGRLPCFNPRPACRANERFCDGRHVSRWVSIRALRAGRMAFAVIAAAVSLDVSIRALRAGRMRGAIREGNANLVVSIRALRAGRMVKRPDDCSGFCVFQSAPCVQGEWIDLHFLAIDEEFQSAPCVQGE